MKNYLYILFLENKTAYKVGITKDLGSRISSIESSFGKLNKEESFVYSCNDRVILEKIESGAHALLSNYPHFHGGSVHNGSSEWFCGESLKKALDVMNIFVNAKIGLSAPCLLENELKYFIDYGAQSDYYKEEIKISNSHVDCMNYIDGLISISKPNISVCQTDGFYIIKGLNIPPDGHPVAIKNHWFKIVEGDLMLDIKAMNQWKISGAQKHTFKLISLKFFTAQSLKCLNMIFENGSVVSHNPIKIRKL